MNAPRRIWIDWKRANEGFVAYDEAPNSTYSECHDEYYSAALFNIVEADLETRTAQLESTLKDRAYIMAERDRTFALMLARAETAEEERDAMLAEAVRLRVKPLEWEPVEAPCTRFKAPALGGHMMVVELDPGTGIYSAGIDMEGLCFRFVQEMTFDEDGYGYSAPAKYATAELAKAAAQADYERRIFASIERDALREGLTDPVAVHANMLRGTIAKPTVDQILHIYPDLCARLFVAEAERDALCAQLATLVAAAELVNPWRVGSGPSTDMYKLHDAQMAIAAAIRALKGDPA